MPEPISRRTYLLAAIRADGRPVSTCRAEQLMAGSPWSYGRNTARKDLRGLSRRGHLTAACNRGRTIYLLKDHA